MEESSYFNIRDLIIGNIPIITSLGVFTAIVYYLYIMASSIYSEFYSWGFSIKPQTIIMLGTSASLTYVFLISTILIKIVISENRDQEKTIFIIPYTAIELKTNDFKRYMFIIPFFVLIFSLLIFFMTLSWTTLLIPICVLLIYIISWDLNRQQKKRTEPSKKA